jgi:cell shape-determining protein MreC
MLTLISIPPADAGQPEVGGTEPSVDELMQQYEQLQERRQRLLKLKRIELELQKVEVEKAALREKINSSRGGQSNQSKRTRYTDTL